MYSRKIIVNSMILHQFLSKRSKSFLISSSSRQTLTKYNPYSRQFHIWTHTNKRIGPHNMDVISVLVGCLLGDMYAKKSKGTNFRVGQSGRHKDYLFFIYDFFYKRGYCSSSGPREYKKILISKSNKRKEYYGYEFDIYSFSSLNWLYDLFYVNGVKTIQPELINYLTPMSLAFLIMDDGCWLPYSKSVRIATNCFTKEEVELLISMLDTKFGLNCTIQLLSKKGGNSPKDKYSIYIRASSFPKLKELVLPYMHSSMLYKLGI